MPARKRKKKQFPILLLIGGGLALIAAALILMSQNNAPAAPTQAPAANIPYPEIERVSLEDAKTALDSGSAVILDVRSAEAFAGQRIAGAVNIPLAELGARLGELDPNQWIITYCT
jgi:3-mercaptopyruvate sulfurtransferase SseA